MDYTNAGEAFEYFTVALNAKPAQAYWYETYGLGYDATMWLYDGITWSLYNPLRNMYGYTTGVPQNFIVDLDGNVRFGMLGGIYSDESILTVVIDELI